METSKEEKVKIYSIFNSIDGEVNHFHQGRFTTFIRFAGCTFAGDNIHCKYCDTKYAQHPDSGFDMSVNEVVKRVKEIGCKKVTITGGEPLAQREDLYKLVMKLSSLCYSISLETNGSYACEDINADSIIMDWKLSNSGIPTKYMHHEHFLYLIEDDFVKFVIGSSLDYEEALIVKKKLKKEGCVATFAFSPVYKKLNPTVLFGWMQKDKVFDVIINLQLHKIMWPKTKVGVEH